MTQFLDVLLVESEPGAGDRSATVLTERGHRVHRCFPTPDPSPTTADHPEPTMCAAVTEGRCPIDGGGIDVALVAGPAAKDRPSLTAPGVTCAIRRHIPVVADDSCTASLGSRAARANGNVVEACSRAAAGGFDDLRADIIRRVSPTLAAEHLVVDDFELRFSTSGPRLTVTVTGPDLSIGLRQAIGVRVLDAVRAAGRVFGQVSVAYDPRR